MTQPLDSYLGIHPLALKLGARRSELLAANLANADTPDYKARDLDFQSALAAASGSSSGSLALVNAGNGVAGTTQSGHIALNTMSSEVGAVEKYRVPYAPALDGNTVDSQVEQANFAENSIRYQATLTFLNGKFRSLMTAITGQ